MVELKVEGREIRFPSELSELTVKQLDKISEIFEKDISEIEQWVEIIAYLSNEPTSEIEEWDYDSFVSLISQLFIRIPQPKKIKGFNVDGISYIAPTKDKLTVRQTSIIEKIYIENQPDKIARVLAVLFDQEGLSNVENLSPEAITAKSLVIREMNLKDFIPFLLTYGGDFLNSIKSMLTNEIKAAN